MIHLRWPATNDPELDHYEVRRGSTWVLGEPVYAGPLPECIVEQHWAAETYLVRARNRGGRLGPSAPLQSTSAVPNGWLGAIGFPIDEAAAWSGSHTNTTTSGGSLVLDTGRLSGIYQTADIDAGSVGRRRWTAYLDAALVDAGATWASLGGTWREQGDRTWAGGETVPTDPGADLETTWASLGGTWASHAGRTWRNEPGALGVHGFCRLEAAFSDDGSSWTAWGAMRPHMRVARYVRFRVRLARVSTDFRVEVRGLYLNAAQDPCCAWITVDCTETTV